MNLPEEPGSPSRWAAIEVAHGSGDYLRCIALRERILRHPLGLSFSPEELERESADVHMAVFAAEPESPPCRDGARRSERSSRCLACLVLTAVGPGAFKMRQVAVDDRIQRRGLGTFLVRAAEGLARGRGATAIVCHARETVVPFYERLGYVAAGEPFEEVGIPHRRMERTLGGTGG